MIADNADANIQAADCGRRKVETARKQMAAALCAAAIAVIAGCAGPGAKVGGRAPMATNQMVLGVMPALPKPPMPRAQAVPGVEVLSPPRPRTAAVTWSNAPAPKGWSVTNYYSALQTTRDFRSWSEVARLPLANRCQVTVTNPPSPQFYRVCNHFAPFSYTAWDTRTQTRIMVTVTN